MAHGLSSKLLLLLFCCVVFPLNVRRDFNLKAERFWGRGVRLLEVGGQEPAAAAFWQGRGRSRAEIGGLGQWQERGEPLISPRLGAAEAGTARARRLLSLPEWLHLGSAGARVFLGWLGARAAGFAPGVMAGRLPERASRSGAPSWVALTLCDVR